jgi:hypothetical protein
MFNYIDFKNTIYYNPMLNRKLIAEFIIFNKKNNFTHLSSALSILPLYMHMLKNDLFENVFLGKPFGFQTFLFLCRKINILTENEFKIVLRILKENEFNGVITQKQLKILKKLKNKGINNFDFFKDLLNEIIYIDSTLGSALSVAQGFAYSIKENLNVIIPDSYFYIGEFLEGIMINKDLDLKNITLHIDYNKSTKQNTINLSILDIQLLLKK